MSTRGIKFVHCHNVKYCSRKQMIVLRFQFWQMYATRARREKVLFTNLLFFSFHLPWALSRCSRPGLTALAYYNNRSKQLAFAELRHLTLELIICNIVQIFMKTWQGNFLTAFTRIWTFKTGESPLRRDPQSDVRDDSRWISPRLSFLLFNFLCSSGNWERAKILLIGEKYISILNLIPGCYFKAFDVQICGEFLMFVSSNQFNRAVRSNFYQ